MRGNLLRLSLTERHELKLFDGLVKGNNRPTRAKFLQTAFGKDWQFNYRDKEYTYIGSGSDGIYVYGAIGKRIVKQHFSPPEEGLRPIAVDYWEKSVFILNIDENQQVAFIEQNNEVGTGVALVGALVSHINRYAGSNEYKIDSFVLPKKNGFWEAIAEYPDPITELSFSYVVPNMFFGGSDATRKSLNKYKERNNAKNVDIKIRNPDGIMLNDDDVRSSVAYVEGGAGVAKAKSGRHIVYSSDDNAESLALPDEVKDMLDAGKTPKDDIDGKIKR